MAARILIIEDNVANLELMRYLLTAFGHIALTCTDGDQAIPLAEREQPHLIICDVQMPTIDGFEVARRLRAHPELSATPLVAVTAYAMVGDRDKLLATGFDGYMSKPIVPQSFVAQIEDFLPRSVRATEPPLRGELSAAQPETGADNKATILVVDDSPENLSFLRSFFDTMGYTVIEARSSAEALAWAQRSKPDLIMSDFHMPLKSGRDLLHAVKADPNLADIPFILISSTAKRADELTEGIEHDNFKFILRPIEPATLLAAVEACLKARKET
jgi:two-component system, cell cycle response regulator